MRKLHGRPEAGHRQFKGPLLVQAIALAQQAHRLCEIAALQRVVTQCFGDAPALVETELVGARRHRGIASRAPVASVLREHGPGRLETHWRRSRHGARRCEIPAVQVESDRGVRRPRVLRIVADCALDDCDRLGGMSVQDRAILGHALQRRVVLGIHLEDADDRCLDVGARPAKGPHRQPKMRPRRERIAAQCLFQQATGFVGTRTRRGQRATAAACLPRTRVEAGTRHAGTVRGAVGDVEKFRERHEPARIAPVEIDRTAEHCFAFLDVEVLPHRACEQCRTRRWIQTQGPLQQRPVPQPRRFEVAVAESHGLHACVVQRSLCGSEIRVE